MYYVHVIEYEQGCVVWNTTDAFWDIFDFELDFLSNAHLNKVLY